VFSSDIDTTKFPSPSACKSFMWIEKLIIYSPWNTSIFVKLLVELFQQMIPITLLRNHLPKQNVIACSFVIIQQFCYNMSLDHSICLCTSFHFEGFWHGQSSRVCLHVPTPCGKHHVHSWIYQSFLGCMLNMFTYMKASTFACSQFLCLWHVDPWFFPPFDNPFRTPLLVTEIDVTPTNVELSIFITN
jgi:hypothetical protein